jgi:hypothetical protein
MNTKILLCFAIFFCAAITTNGQINEGRYLLGGSASFNSVAAQQYSNSKYEALNTNIQLGKVVKDNTVAGLILSYGYFNNDPTNKSEQFSAGVFYRKYKTLANNFFFFGEGDAVYSHSTTTQGIFQTGSNGTKNWSNGAALFFTPGLSYSVCKRMQMELLIPNIFSLSYSHLRTENTLTGTTFTSSTKGNSFLVNANLNSNLLANFWNRI